MDQQQTASHQPAMPAGLLELTPAFTLLQHAWTEYKKRYELYTGILAIPLLGSAIFNILVTRSVTHFPTPMTGVLSLVIGIALMVLFFWSQAAILTALTEHDEKLTVQGAFEKSWPKLLRFLGVSILVGLMIAGGYILLVIPGIIFTIWFIFAQFIFFEEKIESSEAIWKSKRYVKGYFGSVLWRMIVAIFVYAVGAIFLGLIGALFSQNLIISQLLTLVYAAIIGPVLLLYQYNVYKNLKAVRGSAV